MFEFCLVFFVFSNRTFFLSGDQISIMQEVAVSAAFYKDTICTSNFRSTFTSGIGERIFKTAPRNKSTYHTTEPFTYLENC